MAGLNQIKDCRAAAQYAVYSILVGCMLLGGCMLTIWRLWGTAAPDMLWPGLLAFAAWLGWKYGARYTQRTAVRWALRLVPWAVPAAMGAPACGRGVLLFLNGIIQAWNTLHEGGAHLFKVSASGADVLAATLLAAVALGQLTAFLQHRRSVPGLILLAGVMLAPQLLARVLLPWACALYLGGLLGCWFSLPGHRPQKHGMRLLNLSVLVLFVSAALVPAQPMQSMQTLRTGIAGEVQNMRYGSQTLPEGDLAKADLLHQSEEPMLTVHSEQEKDLYLRGFVGSEYENGAWEPLPDSAYSGEFEGILRWLRQNGFDPLTQPAQYEALSEQDELTENTISVFVHGARRNMIYAPASLQQTQKVRCVKKADQRMAPAGLFGKNQYNLTELSGVRPAELTVRKAWVSSPETEAQQQYCRAEEVYRNFVYENYLTQDTALKNTIDELFWQDYDSETEGVYSAVDHIRQVLRENTQYGTPSAYRKNPLQAFLHGQQPGNAVYYAAAAVQALRAKGIPARYAEGYYVSASALQKSGGTAVLTGQDAHAWAEIYFDGVGWLPVDVTPGYYRDAVTLQQMISLPNTPQKTASLQQDGDSAEEAVDNTGSGSAQLPQIAQTVLRTAALVLGVIALLLIVWLVAFALLEIMRIGIWQYKNGLYRRADTRQKTVMLHERLRNLGAVWGVDCRLGWNTAQTDAALAQKVKTVRPGEYTRAAQLLEKALYGGEALAPYELHTLEALIGKLYNLENMGVKQYMWASFCHMQWLPGIPRPPKV